MKKPHYLLICVLTFGLYACNHNIKVQNSTHQETTNTDTKAYKTWVFKMAQSIVDHDHEVCNFSSVDTTYFFSTKDHFTNPETNNKLVLIGGSTGLSSGTLNKLLLLFSSTDTTKVIWSGQASEISTTDILDLNNDGIKEIIMQSGITWMGECDQFYTIFNFKNGTQNYLYQTHSISFINCGQDGHLSQFHKKGDTLENKFDCTLLKLANKKYEVKQINTTKIHNGGHTDEEILKRISITSNTTTIAL